MLSFSWFASFLFFINVVGYEPEAPLAQPNFIPFVSFNKLHSACFALLIHLKREEDWLTFFWFMKLNWSEREDWIELVGMKTYNLLCRIMKSETLQWRQQPINQTNLHFTSIKQKEINFLFLFMKFNESFWFIEENENKKYYNSTVIRAGIYLLSAIMKNFVLNYERQLVDDCDNNERREPLRNEINNEWNEIIDWWDEAMSGRVIAAVIKKIN